MKLITVVSSVIVILMFVGLLPARAAVLPVPEKFQEKTNWCWAGVSQAILSYYGTAYTQTAIGPVRNRRG